MSAEPDNFHHVRDFPSFELPLGLKIDLPVVFGLQITKFMVLQLVAAAFVLFVFRGVASRVRKGEPVRGRFWNFWEALALFIRDEVVRPTIGEADHGHGDPGHDSHAHSAASYGGHSADKYLPFIWSCFFYVLICNLLGALPFLGSATGNINVTAALAVTAMGATFVYGSQVMGVFGFFGNLIPDTGVGGFGGFALGCLMFVIELLGFVIKHSILALRLFGNIMGGHTALGVMLAFIGQAVKQGPALWSVITLGSIAGQIGIGMLELLVAVLQAYVFSFLATIFIAGSIHKH